MAQVYGIGETVYDILFKNNAPVGVLLSVEEYRELLNKTEHTEQH